MVISTRLGMDHPEAGLGNQFGKFKFFSWISLFRTLGVHCKGHWFDP